MRIAFIGQKGLPATSGGVERHVEELAVGLAELGHDVTVFSRPSYSGFGSGDYRGVHVVQLPTIASKHLDAIVHSLVSTLYCLTHRFDVVHYQGIGPSLVTPLARLRRGITVSTIHAEDWRQGKWGAFARAVLRIGESAALNVPHRTIVVSDILRRAAESRHASVTVIPNGVSLSVERDDSVLDELGIGSGQFGLFVGRLIPDKGVHELAQAWREAALGVPLVIVGGSSFTDSYAASLTSAFGHECIFAGPVFGARLASLFESCGLFVLPSHVEGMPIVLLEALGYGAAVVASDLPENMDVLGDLGMFFEVGNVPDLISVLRQTWPEREELAERARQRSGERLEGHDWLTIARDTEAVYTEALRT